MKTMKINNNTQSDAALQTLEGLLR